MANGENLKGKGFDSRSTEELREIARKGGKASGETRRKKANFRKTLNALLTAEIDSPEWTPMLKALGLDSTLEAAINAAIIKEALSGDVKAYMAIRDTLGLTTKSKKDLKEQEARTEALKAKAQKEDAGPEEKIADYLDALKEAVKEE